MKLNEIASYAVLIAGSYVYQVCVLPGSVCLAFCQHSHKIADRISVKILLDLGIFIRILQHRKTGNFSKIWLMCLENF